MLHDQESFAKNWVGPLKDAAGSGSLTVKMARDFGSWKGVQIAFSRNAKDTRSSRSRAGPTVAESSGARVTASTILG